MRCGLDELSNVAGSDGGDLREPDCGGPRCLEHLAAGWIMFGSRIHTWHSFQKPHRPPEAADPSVELDDAQLVTRQWLLTTPAVAVRHCLQA